MFLIRNTPKRGWVGRKDWVATNRARYVQCALPFGAADPHQHGRKHIFLDKVLPILSHTNMVIQCDFNLNIFKGGHHYLNTTKKFIKY